jgi:hypothetical protein
MALIRLEPKGFYRFGSHKGLKPVDVWIGRIDEPADFEHRVGQPVVSMVITSMRPGMPVIGIAPFYLSALFPEGVAAIPPFVMPADMDFAQNYREWRTAWEDGEAQIWDVGPSEVYVQAIRAMMEGQSQIRRPQ